MPVDFRIQEQAVAQQNLALRAAMSRASNDKKECMNFKVGDRLVSKCQLIDGFHITHNIGNLASVVTIHHFENSITAKFDNGSTVCASADIFNDWFTIVKKEEKNMLKEIATDAKEFVKNNRNVIYTIVVVALVDHFVFKGALRDRLKGLLEKMLNKAEKSVE